MQQHSKPPDANYHIQLCKKLQEALQPFLYKKTYQKNGVLLNEGTTCSNIYFVRSGAIKQYYLSDGKEFIQNFFFEGSMACHFNSFLTQTPSSSFLEVLEGSELWILSFHNYRKISEASPKFHEQIAVCMAKMNAIRVNLLLQSDAELRYKKFLIEEAGLLQKVPQYMIASYLGMTLETLNRIRKKIANNAA
jgi:CRP-like cAMP-binding protein